MSGKSNSNPIGATHALVDLIWNKIPNLSDEKARYDLTFCDTVTGGVKYQCYDLSSSEAKAEIEKQKELKGFAYKRK